MTPSTAFSLEKHIGAYETWPLKTRLFFDGVDTGTSVPGFCIEAQYECHEGYLLAMSWDCPFEEANDFVLLDRAFKLLARKTLGAWYHTFLLESHAAMGPDVVRFLYNGGMRCDVGIERPKLLWSVKPRLSMRLLDA